MDFEKRYYTSQSRRTASFRDDLMPYQHSQPGRTESLPKSKVRIGPLFKKLARETNSLDLNRSAAENELGGIYSLNVGAKSAADIGALPAGRSKGFHTRSTSGTSQFSTASSGYKQYVHPRRQTPRPYTPPLAQSHATSVMSSESGDDEDQPRRLASQRSVSFGSGQPLRLRTNTDSSQRLLHGSHTNLSITPSSLRLASDPLASEPLSPVSRKSFDRTFRSRRRDDSASFAESVHAARAEWNAKQASKAQKAEKHALRESEKAERARQKRDPQTGSLNEKHLGTAYADIRESHPGTSRNQGGVTMRWTAFVVWLRIRVRKIGQKVGKLF